MIQCTQELAAGIVFALIGMTWIAAYNLGKTTVYDQLHARIEAEGDGE